MYYTQDADNVRRNMVTVIDSRPAYNAVIEIISKTKKDGATDPVTVADVKAFSHIDESDDDVKINMLIPAACDMIENYLGIGLRQLEVKARVVNGEGSISLPYGLDGTAKDEDGNDVDLSISNRKEQILSYDAGTDEINPDLKVIVLMQIDFVLRGGVGLDNQVKQLLQNYMT